MFETGSVSTAKRVDYNARIIDILQGKFGIDLHEPENPRFAEMIRTFAGVIGERWYANSSPEAAALQIVFRYMVDKLQAGGPAAAEARNLTRPLLDFLAEATAAGKISTSDASNMLAYHNEHSWRGCEVTVPAEDYCRAL